MANCPSCGSILSERGIYCFSCAKQARCKECRDLLEPNARACVSCGTFVGEGTTTNTANTHQPVSQMNTFMLKETMRSRTVEVSFSDTAIVNLGDILGYVESNRAVARTPFSHTIAAPTNPQPLLPGIIENRNEATDAESTAEQPEAQQSTEGGTETDRDRLRQVFFYEGERLVLDNLHLKATGQLDAGKRLVYLFLYAHNLEGRQHVSRENINAVLKDVGLYDPNIANWISTSSDLRESMEGEQPMFRLRSTGRTEAKRILEQVMNPDIADEWPLSDRSRSRSRSSSDSGHSEKPRRGRPGRKKSTEPDSWAERWNSVNLGIDGHSIVNEASSLNKGLFGLWAIRKATGDAVQIVSKGNLSSFIHKAFVVSVAQSTLGDALASKNAKGKVLRVAGGYQITPTGMAEIESLAGLKKADASVQPKNSSKKKS